jgi:hypothetical protein
MPARANRHCMTVIDKAGLKSLGHRSLATALTPPPARYTFLTAQIQNNGGCHVDVTMTAFAAYRRFQRNPRTQWIRGATSFFWPDCSTYPCAQFPSSNQFTVLFTAFGSRMSIR